MLRFPTRPSALTLHLWLLLIAAILAALNGWLWGWPGAVGIVILLAISYAVGRWG